ncbi:Metallo-dependent phosphatase-like protein [Ochromonadaceae sp. CCMP2298]|nr:Metallo-dependent phosphatase-like protein [Ochromonadaceae sp. CCMP2298]
MKTEVQGLAERFLKVFQDPTNYITYLQSDQFGKDLLQVCQEVSTLLEQQPRCLFLQSPVYVFGDIHGNLEDLHFFSDNIWKMGMDLTAGKFLFLGDYVDRGQNCLECVAYLFGLKILYPHKIDLLRGNHETRDVNGWEDHYGEKSFLFQCKQRFGEEFGEEIWEECNQTFDRLPLAAVIDHEIFCIHGGLPRPVDHEGMTEIESILAMPNIVSIMPPYEHEEEWMRQVATDCIWSDPASEDMELDLDETGFGESSRGGGAVCFGSQAIENFLQSNNLSYIIRAHEAHAYGVALSKGARVFTVFSTSKDHRQGQKAMAGCVLVDCDKIQVINRSPNYQNKYVHRRTSIALENLSSNQVSHKLYKHLNLESNRQLKLKPLLLIFFPLLQFPSWSSAASWVWCGSV